MGEMDDIYRFVAYLKKKFRKVVDEDLISHLEGFLQANNFDRAYSVAAIICQRIPENLKTSIYYRGMDLLREKTRTVSYERYKGARENSPHIKKQLTHQRSETCLSPRLEQELKMTDSETDIRYYIKILSRGITEENLDYLRSVQEMGRCLPCNRELTNIATSVLNLFDRLFLYSEELEDVCLNVKTLTRAICDRNKECIFEVERIEDASEVSQMLRKIAYSVETTYDELDSHGQTIKACFNWMTDVAMVLARTVPNGSCNIPQISEDAILNTEEYVLYESALKLFADLWLKYSQRRNYTDNNSPRSMINESNRQVQKLSKENKELSMRKLSSDNKALRENEGEVFESKRLIQVLFKENEELYDSIHKIKENKEHLEQKNLNLTEQICLCENELDHLQKTLESSRKEYLHMDSVKDLEEKEKKLKSLLERNDSLKKQLEIKNMQIKKSSSKLTKAEMEVEDLHTRYEREKQNKLHLEASNAQLKTEKKDMAIRERDLAFEIEKLKTDLQREKNNKGDIRKRQETEIHVIQRLEAEKKRLQKERDESINSKRKQEQQFEDITKKLKNVEQERDALQHRYESDKQIKDHLADLNAQLKTEMQDMLISKRKQEQQFEDVTNKMKNVEQERDALQHSNNVLSVQKEQIKKDLDEAKMRRDGFEMSNNVLSVQKEQIKKDLDEAKMRRDGFEMRNDQKTTKLEELHREIQTMNAKQGDISKRYESVKQLNIELEATIASLEMEKKDLIARYEQQNVEISHLQTSLQRTKKECKKLFESYVLDSIEEEIVSKHKQEQQFEYVTEKLKNVEQERDGLQHSNNTLSKQNEQIKGDLDEVKMRRDGFEMRNDQNTTKLDELHREIQTMNAKQGDISKRYESEKQLNVEREGTIASLEMERKTLIARKEELEGQVNQLKRELHNEKKDRGDISKSKEELEKLLKKSDKDLQNAQKELQSAYSNREDLQKSKEELEKLLKKSDKDLQNAQKELQSAYSNREDLQKRIEQEQDKNQRLQQNLISKQNEEWQEQIKDKYQRLQKQLMVRERELQNMKQEMGQLKEKNDDLQNRFSKVAAVQLTHDNPNIADLSDKNRPTKLGESFSELYDNEWTEAFSVIEDNSTVTTEEGIAQQLRDILLSCYNHCSDVSQAQINGLKALLITPNTDNIKHSTRQDLSPEQSKIIVDLRKQTYKTAATSIQNEMISKYPDSMQFRALKAFIEKCTELCWLMVIQSPPVYIDGSRRSGDMFDKDAYKAYTRSGQVIEYVVWPPLYLHRGGPLLCKGTAQGKM